MGSASCYCKNKLLLTNENSLQLSDPIIISKNSQNSLYEEYRYDLTSKNNKSSNLNREFSINKLPNYNNTYKSKNTIITKESGCLKGKINSLVSNMMKNKRRKSFAIAMTSTFKSSKKKLSGILRNETGFSNKTTIKAYEILPKNNKKFFTTYDKDTIKKINVEKNIKEKEINFNNSSENDNCESTRSKSNDNKQLIQKPSSFLRAKRKYKTTQVKEKIKSENLPIQIIDKKLNQKQTDLLKKILLENELINEKEMSESLINTILNLISYQKIKDNYKIFTQDNKNEDIYYMISKGDLLYSIDDDIYELNHSCGISTQALLRYSKNKCYIKTLGKTYLFVLPLMRYRKILEIHEKKRIEEISFLLNKNYFFKNLPIDKLKELVKNCITLSFNEKTTIIEEDYFNYSLYYIMSGSVKCSKNNIVIKTLNENEIFNDIGLIYQIESYYKYSAEADSILIQIQYDDIIALYEEKTIEFFVDNMLINAVKENQLFLSNINMGMINKIIPIFQLHYYFNDNILTKKEKKVILPIFGTIIKSKKSIKDLDNILNFINLNYTNQIEKGKLNLDSITSDTTLNFNLMGDECIVFECHWENLVNKIINNNLFLINNIQPSDFIKNLKTIPLYHFINPFKMFQIVNSMYEKKYKKGQIILKQGPISEKFFYIQNGEVEITIKNISIKTLIPGQYFGDIISKEEENKKKFDFKSKTQTTIFIIKKHIFEDIVYQDDLFKPLRQIIKINNFSFENFFYIRDLGSGSYGRVYLVHNKKKFFALKTAEIRIISENKKNAVSYINENAIMSSLEYPFIVHLDSAYKTKDYIFFLIEYVNGINLRTYIEKQKKNELRDLQVVKFYGAILFLVLQYLNQRKIIHRDLKPENIMMNSKGFLKVIDFGVAKNLIGQNFTNSIVGTPLYMSPEIILGKDYNYKVDYWSVGIILYEIFYGNTPFGSSTGDVNKIYKEILENKPFLTSDPKNKILNNLINSLLSKKPSSRISSFQDIKNHEFFKDFDFEKLLNFNCVAPYTPDEFINKNEDEFLKNEFTPLVNFIKNCIYQNSTEIDENMWKQHLDDCFINY